MPSGADPDYLTFAEAAELVGISATTLVRWAREGRIPTEVTADGERVIRRDELLKRVVRIDSPPPPEDESE
ncbi:MAG: helix-turn-helix domain-containing protein [Actinomycetota bacterium]|nr:helix-turn-helix domain-containing protein [Actinomycetota bacterium]